MITGAQIRMAKAALKWSNTDLAEKTDLHKNTLNKAENGTGRPATFALIKSVFEAEGISFIPSGVLYAGDEEKLLGNIFGDSSSPLGRHE